MQPFIVTLAGMFLGRGLVALIEVNQIQVDNAGFEMLSGARIQIPFLGDANKKGVFIQSKLEYGVIVALIIVCLMFWLLKEDKTRTQLLRCGRQFAKRPDAWYKRQENQVLFPFALWLACRDRWFPISFPHSVRLGSAGNRP